MAKKIRFESEVTSIDSYMEGEKFYLTMPEITLDLDLKLGKSQYGKLRWDPWPEEPNVIRRMGRFLLKSDSNIWFKVSTYDWKSGKYKTHKKLFRLVAEADENGEPIEWLLFNTFRGACAAAKKLGELEGRSIKDIVVETLKKDEEWFQGFVAELEEENRRWVAGENLKAGYEKYPPDFKQISDRDIHWRITQSKRGKALIDKLKAEQAEKWEPYEDLLDKVFGKGKNLSSVYGGYFYGHHSEETRNKIFYLELEWYRKHLMKLQRKLRREHKKKIMAERDVSAEALAAEKEEQKRLERRAKRTTEWVKVSKDVHNTLDWLQEFVERMGRCEEIDQDWFDKNRRELRALATKMKPLSRVLNY